MNEKTQMEREQREREAKARGKTSQPGRTTASLNLSDICEKDAVKKSVNEFVRRLNWESESKEQERDEMEQMMDR